jgi:hypothetical protein
LVKRVWSIDEERFLDPKSGEVYVYVSPNPPTMPIWEKVDVLGHLEAPDPFPIISFQGPPNNSHNGSYHEDET